jgi:hypothetical protein
MKAEPWEERCKSSKNQDVGVEVFRVKWRLRRHGPLKLWNLRHHYTATRPKSQRPELKKFLGLSKISQTVRIWKGICIHVQCVKCDRTPWLTKAITSDMSLYDLIQLTNRKINFLFLNFNKNMYFHFPELDTRIKQKTARHAKWSLTHVVYHLNYWKTRREMKYNI